MSPIEGTRRHNEEPPLNYTVSSHVFRDSLSSSCSVYGILILGGCRCCGWEKSSVLSQATTFRAEQHRQRALVRALNFHATLLFNDLKSIRPVFGWRELTDTLSLSCDFRDKCCGDLMSTTIVPRPLSLPFCALLMWASYMWTYLQRTPSSVFLQGQKRQEGNKNSSKYWMYLFLILWKIIPSWKLHKKSPLPLILQLG